MILWEDVRIWTLRASVGLGLVFLAWSLLSCSNRTRPTDLGTGSITLRRTACYGICPVYAVTLRGSGSVEYVGEHHVDIPGRRTGTISPEHLRELLKAADDIHFWSLQDHYAEECTDQPTAVISISAQGRTKEISNYFGGCSQETSGPQVDLSRLARAIDDASGATTWIHCDEDCLKKQIQAGLEVNAPAPDGTSLLMLAIQRSNLERICVLLDAGAHVNVADGSGTTPLMLAGMSNNVEIVRELLARGADVRAKDKKGYTVLDMAGGKEVRKLLKQASRH